MNNKKKWKNSSEDEVDAIRLALYEKYKHMSDTQMNEEIGKHTLEIAKQFGFKIVN